MFGGQQWKKKRTNRKTDFHINFSIADGKVCSTISMPVPEHKGPLIRYECESLRAHYYMQLPWGGWQSANGEEISEQTNTGKKK